jgi:ABC-type glycerol-3-phosphate transport system substrate-binding protein
VKRTLAVVSIAALSSLSLSACVSSVGGGDSASPAASKAPGEKISLTFSSYAWQDPTVQATQEIVDSWNKANPDIQVDYQKVDPNSVHDKLVTQFAGNQAPDIIHDEAADIAGFSQQGYLADLGPNLPDDLKSDIPGTVWKSVTFDGKITGVPTIAQVYNVFVNTDMLTKAGVNPPTAAAPWTWDDLAANAKKLTSDGVHGFAWGLKSPTAGIQSTGLSFGGVFMSGDEKTPTMTVTDKEMAVPTKVQAMLQDGSMAPTSTTLSGTDVLAGFYGGKYAMMMNGNYVATQITAKAPAGFNWTMIPLIKGTSQNQAANPQTLSVAKQSKYPAEAMKFIAHYNKAENLAKLAKGDSLIPMTDSAASIMKKEMGSANGWDVILDSGKNLVDAPWNKATKFPQWKSEIATPAYQEFLAGKIDAATLQARLGDGWKKINS